jgi:hypothetical protein
VMMRHTTPQPSSDLAPSTWARRGGRGVPGRVQEPVRQWDAAGLSWTRWEMIQNLRHADLAHSGATDATRTERGFHAARNGVSAGQRLFRWVGSAHCKTVGTTPLRMSPRPSRASPPNLSVSGLPASPGRSPGRL